MNDQLRWITGILDSYNIPYWIDAGTLLGVMRDGDVISTDDDIDLAIWNQHETHLKNALRTIKNSRYWLRTSSYKQLVCKYELKPRSNRGKIIEIHVYRAHGSFAWCPEIYRYNPHRRSTHAFYCYFLYRYGLFGVMAILLRQLWVSSDEARLPWRRSAGIGTWIIPRIYFDDLVRDRELNLSMPRNWRSYLTFRYGNWKQPVTWREWRYYIDDHGFQRRVPPYVKSK